MSKKYSTGSYIRLLHVDIFEHVYQKFNSKNKKDYQIEFLTLFVIDIKKKNQ